MSYARESRQGPNGASNARKPNSRSVRYRLSQVCLKARGLDRLRSYEVFFAYCGTYEVREKENRVIHRPELGSSPHYSHYIGTGQSRNFRSDGDRLILSGEETASSGERSRYEIIRQRVSANMH